MEPDKDYNLLVGLRIREIREAFQMTRAEFSEKCDISESFLAAVESGKKSITSKTLYKICTALNVSADYFILGKNNDFKTDTALELLNSLDDFSRESAMYILRQWQKYIAADEPELRLHRSILECPNKGVRNDADMIQYNIPDLFVD